MDNLAHSTGVRAFYLEVAVLSMIECAIEASFGTIQEEMKGK